MTLKLTFLVTNPWQIPSHPLISLPYKVELSYIQATLLKVGGSDEGGILEAF